MNLQPAPRPNRRRALRAACAALAIAVSTTLAQAFPDKPLRIIHGGPPGGALDVQARILGDAISPMLGQPVIVEAKPGGVGALSVSELLAAPRDGHTVMANLDGLFTEVPHSLKTKYDPFTDLRPLAELSSVSLMLVAHPGVPANNVAELVAHVKSKPAGSFSFASYSTGTISHVLGIMLNRAAGIEMNHVPYKGTPPALQDLMGGHVPVAFVGESALPPLVKSEKIKLLASTGATRSALFPDVPTFAEAGFPQIQATVRILLYVTPGMPAPAQAKWREAVAAALKQERTHQRMAELGMTPAAQRSQDDIAKALRADHEKIGAVLKSINFKAE